MSFCCHCDAIVMSNAAGLPLSDDHTCRCGVAVFSYKTVALFRPYAQMGMVTVINDYLPQVVVLYNDIFPVPARLQLHVGQEDRGHSQGRMGGHILLPDVSNSGQPTPTVNGHFAFIGSNIYGSRFESKPVEGTTEAARGGWRLALFAERMTIRRFGHQSFLSRSSEG